MSKKRDALKCFGYGAGRVYHDLVCEHCYSKKQREEHKRSLAHWILDAQAKGTSGDE
jgi:hypothetical protein